MAADPQQPERLTLDGPSRVIFGGAGIAACSTTAYVGVTSLAAMGMGMFALAAVPMAIAYALCIVTGIHGCIRSAIMMGKGFGQEQREREERNFNVLCNKVEYEKWSTQAARDFNIKAAEPVKIMRPLKLSPKQARRPS